VDDAFGSDVEDSFGSDAAATQEERGWQRIRKARNTEGMAYAIMMREQKRLELLSRVYKSQTDVDAIKKKD